MTRGWWGALLLSLALFGLCGLELSARRGWDASPYLANKVLASTAVLLVTASFLARAARRRWHWSTPGRTGPKHLGITGFAYAAAHVALTFVVQDPEKDAYRFPLPEFYLDNLAAVLFGVAAFLILVNSARLSLFPGAAPVDEARLRRRRMALRCGMIAVPATIIHVVTLKYPGWIEWLATMEPHLPPLSLLVAGAAVALEIARVLLSRQPHRADLEEDLIDTEQAIDDLIGPEA